VPSQSIAQNLAFVNWSMLVALALGCFGIVVLGRLRTGATRGFLGFTAFCAAAFAALAWLSDTALPTAVLDSPVVVDPAWQAPRRPPWRCSRRARSPPRRDPAGLAAVPVAVGGLLVGVACSSSEPSAGRAARSTASRSSSSRGCSRRRPEGSSER
jgi:hypothetical protein